MKTRKQTETEMLEGDEISDTEYAKFCIGMNLAGVKVQRDKAKALRRKPKYDDPKVNEAFARAAELQAEHHQQIADALSAKMPTLH